MMMIISNSLITHLKMTLLQNQATTKAIALKNIIQSFDKASLKHKEVDGNGMAGLIKYTEINKL